jgi:two-component system, cell cycle sensor histidine kinase and response regulator CckA
MTAPVTYEELLKKIKNLEESIETYQVLVNNSPDLLYRTDLEGRITFVSPSVYRLSGYTTEEAVGMKMAEEVYFFPEQRMAFLETLQKTGRVTNYEAQLKRKDGSIWWASTNARLYKDKDGNVTGVEGITRDIGEIKAAENALRESEERFRLTFQTSPDVITLTSVDNGRYIDINEGFTKILGYAREDVIGKSALALNIWKNPEDRQQLVDGLAKDGYVENLEAEFISKGGKIRTGLMSARLVTINEKKVILMITREISEWKRMEQQLQQSQKFEAIATLAGGVAHDFNNLLMGIQGRVSLVSVDLDRSHPHLEHMKAIDDYIRSAADLTKQLLGFARGGKYEVIPTDINELVNNSVKLFGRTKKEIRIHTKYQDPPPVVALDRTQIEQVLLNVYVNAWQAMPGGGEIFLETQIVVLDDAGCSPYQAAPGRYAKISVSDTGVGMDDSTRSKIFDPFFTTKGKSRGTGLGLASAYGIIKNHAGIITVDSELGRGTTFNIYLPLSDKEACREHPIVGRLVKGSETVLLVDDEEMILEVGQAMLKELGYRVVVAGGGEQALDVIKRRGDEIDLVILDLIMPDMNGGKAFNGIKEIRPPMPVMLSSGYSINGQAEEIMKRGCNGFIQKPFNISELSQKIRKILDEAGESGQQEGS